MSTQNVLVETKGRVGIIRFNRPQALNALNAALVGELIAAIDGLEADANIGCLLLTGSDSLYALALHLGLLGWDFEVLDPPELREALATLGARFTSAAVS